MSDSVEKEDFLLIAHRGGMFYKPQNTLAAFGYSVQQRILWAECDIRLSRDGVPVVVHDDRILMPDGTKRAIRDLTVADLLKIDAGGGEYIPSLQEVLSLYSRNLSFYIEIKELDAVATTIEILRAGIDLEKIFISSFLPDALQLLKETDPDITRAFLVDRLAGKIAGCKSAVKTAALLECKYFLPQYRRVKPEWVKAAHDEGIKVIPWTVNKLKDASRMIECGVDGIITDCPLALKELIPAARIAK